VTLCTLNSNDKCLAAGSRKIIRGKTNRTNPRQATRKLDKKTGGFFRHLKDFLGLRISDAFNANACLNSHRIFTLRNIYKGRVRFRLKQSTDAIETVFVLLMSKLMSSSNLRPEITSQLLRWPNGGPPRCL
jgi:hypothetical protein